MLRSSGSPTGFSSMFIKLPPYSVFAGRRVSCRQEKHCLVLLTRLSSITLSITKLQSIRTTKYSINAGSVDFSKHSALTQPEGLCVCSGNVRVALQVCSVLESLEQEYKREEDWCGGADKLGPNCETDHVTPMISKHLEQKEAFLKVPLASGYSMSELFDGLQ